MQSESSHSIAVFFAFSKGTQILELLRIFLKDVDKYYSGVLRVVPLDSSLFVSMT